MVVKKNVKSTKSSKSRAVISEKIKHEKNQKKVLLVAQEIQFAKVLAGNDPNLRARGVKRLHKWLKARSQSDCDLKKDDFSRLWKGLYYCMWMADKPLFQEELAETISSLIHCFGHSNPAIQFMEAFFRMMAQEWIGIDQHRFDKFLMLVRRFLRQCLVFVEQKDWNLEIAEQVSLAFQKTVLPNHEIKADVPPPPGLVMHFSDVFLEELAKVSNGVIDEKIFLCFLTPFTLHLLTVGDARLRRHIQDSVFYKLINQTPVALEHEEKFAAWSKMGFPGGTIDVMQRVEDDEGVAENGDNEEEEEDELNDEDDNTDNGDNEEEDDEEDELIQNAIDSQNVLDPRAGGVDVELPLLNFEPQSIINHLRDHQFKKYTNSKSRKRLTNLIKAFEKIAENKYPFAIPKVPAAGQANLRRLRSKATEDLYKYERQLYEDDESEEDYDDAHSDDDDEEVDDENKDDAHSDDEDDAHSDDDKEDDDSDVKEEEEDTSEESEKNESSDEDIKISNDKKPSKKPLKDCKSKKLHLTKISKSQSLSKDISGDVGAQSAVQVAKKLPKKLQNDLKSKKLLVPNKVSNSSHLVQEDGESDGTIQSEQPPPKKMQKLQKLHNASSGDTTKKQRLGGLKFPGETKLTNGKSCGKSEEDIEVEKLSQIQITPSDGTEERVSTDTEANSGDATQSGTHALLQHLAPHLVGSKKLKRRASCDATLQTTPVSKGVKNNNISSPKSEGKKSKRKSLGWDEPLQEGEYEIVIPREKIVAQKKRLSDANNVTFSPSTPKLDMKNPFSTPVSGKKLRTPGSSSKKVNFIPERNMAQSQSEYFRTLRENPEIPYDANKEPSRGVLKPSPYSSPVNPFYKRKLKI